MLMPILFIELLLVSMLIFLGGLAIAYLFPESRF